MALIRCAKCGGEYSSNVEKCPKCDFVPDVFVCSECKNLCKKEDKACAKCGNPLKAEETFPATIEEVQAAFEKTIEKFKVAQTLKDWWDVYNELSLIQNYVDVSEYLNPCKNKINELSVAAKKEANYKKLLQDIENEKKPANLLPLLEKLNEYAGYEGVEDAKANGLLKWKELVYVEACGSKNNANAIALFEKLGDYKDSVEKKDERTKAIADKKAKTKKIGVIVTVAAVVVVAIALVFNMYLIPKGNYDDGVEAYKAKDYDLAIEFFTAANGYDDSAELIVKCHYEAGIACLDGEKYRAASEHFDACGDYKDAKKLYNYSEGMFSFEASSYDDAREKFEDAGNVRDAKKMINACSLMIAEEHYDDGDLKEAKRLFSKLPSDFEYDGISVSERLATLEQYSAFVNLLGHTWKTSSSYMEVKQTHDSTGIWENWYNSDFGGEFEIESCKILSDGKVKIEGSTSFWTYTKFSSLSSIVDKNQKYKTVNFTETVSGLPNGLEIGSYTKLTISGNKATVNYYKYSPNESSYFTYLYKTDMSFTY